MTDRSVIKAIVKILCQKSDNLEVEVHLRQGARNARKRNSTNKGNVVEFVSHTRAHA